MTETLDTTIATADRAGTTSARLSAPEIARQQGMNPVDYLRQRGFIHDLSDEAGLRKAFDEGTVTYYIGFDPTGPSLHAGHMVSIMLLASLQRMGHRPIALGGGGTAMVGDPTGKTVSREIIKLEDLEANLRSITGQLAKYLDFEGDRFAGGNPAATLVNNADWLLHLQYIPFLRDIGKHFSVNEMLSLETYKTRIESGNGLNFVEFNYRLVQAYDFLHLFREVGCTLQMGGSDQWANITGGVDLIRRADQGKAFALVSPLVTTASGEKMGKTGSGVRVWLDPEQFSPYDYYQYWVNTDDVMVETYLNRFTFLPNDEIAALTSVAGEALREAKRVLAFEATALAHGVDAAEQAEHAAKALFSGGGAGGSITAADASLPTTEIPSAEVADLTLADAFVLADLAKGRGEARRLATQGGLSVDDVKVEDVDLPLADVLSGRDAVILRAGKKRFKRVAIG
ncbi:MAG: tyrosine--tRNA ligase [Thermomicrobiales bacterium]